MVDLSTLVRQANAVNLTSAACLTALLYNHVLTLDQEINKMWPTRFSIAKFLFFTNRYPVEAILLFNCISASQPYQSDKFCVFYLRWLTVSILISTAVVQGILIMRVWVLYQRNKLALYIAFFFYIGGVATLVGLVIKDYVGEDVLINTMLASLPGCYATSVPSIIAGTWIAPLIVETVLFIFVVARAFYWWRDGISVPSIFILLARDSTLYFTLVFTFLLANYLVFQFGPPFLSNLLVMPSATTGCILGSHMMINMRMMAEHSGDTIKSQLGTIPVISTHDDDLSMRTRRGGRRRGLGLGDEFEFEDGLGLGLGGRGQNHNIEFSEMYTLPSTPMKDTVFLDRALTPMSDLEFASPEDDCEARHRRVGFAL